MKHNHNGNVSSVVLLVVATLLLVLVSIFAVIQTSNVSKYKNNTNQLIASAVVQAKSAQQTLDNASYQKQIQSPFASYLGPASYGSISFSYPKNWSSYINNTSDGIDGFFYPGSLPSVDDASASNYSLRIKVANSSYSDTLNGYSSSDLSVVPYSLPKVQGDIGVQIKGKLNNGKTGTLIILPLRTQTLQIWTEGGGFNNEFNQILSSLTFIP